MKQLQRNIKGKIFTCEYSGNYSGAMNRKVAAKYGGFKVRVFKSICKNKTEYQVFIN